MTIVIVLYHEKYKIIIEQYKAIKTQWYNARIKWWYRNRKKLKGWEKSGYGSPHYYCLYYYSLQVYGSRFVQLHRYYYLRQLSLVAQ